jgi:hypothetical protein
VNGMYQYSLCFYKATYNRAIDASIKRTSAQARAVGVGLGQVESAGSGRGVGEVALLREQLDSLVTAVTEDMLDTVGRGLFEAHQTLFSTLVCLAVARAAGFHSCACTSPTRFLITALSDYVLAAGDVHEREWILFLRGGSARSSGGSLSTPPDMPPAIPANPNPNANPIRSPAFLSPSKWAQCLALEELLPESFSRLQACMSVDAAKWSVWACAPAPHTLSPPAPFEKLGGTFQLVMLIKVVREEAAGAALSAYVSQYMSRSMGTTFRPFPLTPLALGEVLSLLALQVQKCKYGHLRRGAARWWPRRPT